MILKLLVLNEDIGMQKPAALAKSRWHFMTCLADLDLPSAPRWPRQVLEAARDEIAAQEYQAEPSHGWEVRCPVRCMPAVLGQPAATGRGLREPRRRYRLRLTVWQYGLATATTFKLCVLL